MISAELLTFDVDWVPDWMIEEIAERLEENEVKATWFITHDSPMIRELQKLPELFEVGIHPNFSPDSTQGRSVDQVLESLLNIAPEARSVRSHALLFSDSIMRRMIEHGIKIDSSILLFNSANICPHYRFVNNHSCLIRVPYFWEDDVEAERPDPSFRFDDVNLRSSGIKIFDFHPIHIALNSRFMTDYLRFKGRGDIRSCRKDDVEPFINPGKGASTFFGEMVEHLRKTGSMTMSECAQRWEAMA